MTPREPDILRPAVRRDRFQGFQDLMRHRVQDVLLVASLYDCFILEEDGQLNELVLGEFLDLNLRHTPGLTLVSSGQEALQMAREDSRYNLVISTFHVGDLNALELARKFRQENLDVPVVLLAYDNRELKEFVARNDVADIERIFLWQGDVRILLAIIKYVEDKWNVEHDTRAVGVPVILVVEDNVRYYSSFLPLIYTEVFKHSQNLISEGVNLSHKVLRMRARPKILLVSTWEDAVAAFERYRDNVLGVLTDVQFPREGVSDPRAGADFVRVVKEQYPDIPVMMQSSRPENAELARELGAAFLLKGSPTLLHDLRSFMIEHFAFGDFVFRLPDGTEVARARDLKDLEEKLRVVPAESIAYHGARNHFSLWLKMRTEFALAHRLRPRKVGDFPDLEALRAELIRSIAEYRREREQGIIIDFTAENFDPETSFARIGGGSLGGKARGLAFVRLLLDTYRVDELFPGVRIFVPPAVILGTDVFDEFLETNGLRDFALVGGDDDEILARFLAAPFPERAAADLRVFLERVDQPLAVRSSSLLEDSQYQPFTGVYDTFMLPNVHGDVDVRLEQLVRTVKRVYASTFSRRAKDYIRATPYRLEEEKMAVIVQPVVGAVHGERFYPDFSGVARSWNFYPTPPLRAEDGIAAVALGLGRTVVDGETCLRFCPRYPKHLVQFSSVRDMLENSQREFWAIDLAPEASPEDEAFAREVRVPLAVAERDGTLGPLASTWSPENDAIYDGVSRRGVRLVSFAPILKYDVFPLARILTLLLRIGQWGMSMPVEIEFAVNYSTPPGKPKEFAILQMRPLTLSGEEEELEIGELPPEAILCRTGHVLGHGRIDDVRDIVVVDAHRFDRSRSRDAAREVARFNARLLEEHARYLLVGVGRWGSADPWLGIPVAWSDINGARAIVEAGFRDFQVQPSQGTHFFQNLTSFRVGYFTVNPELGDGILDWDWLASRPAVESGRFVRHLRLDEPLTILMNGRTGEGVILKPGWRPRDGEGDSSPPPAGER